LWTKYSCFTFDITSHDVTLLNVHFEPCKVHENLLHLQFAWDISNTTEAGRLNQMTLAADSPNFPNPAETRIDALMYTAATLADPTLAAPPNDAAPVSLQSWDPKMGVVPAAMSSLGVVKPNSKSVIGLKCQDA